MGDPVAPGLSLVATTHAHVPREEGVVTCTCAGWSIATVSETVAKALASRKWFREPGGHCIDCRDPFSPGVAL